MQGGLRCCDAPEQFIFLDLYNSKFKDCGHCPFGRMDQDELAALFKKSKARCKIVIGETDYIKNLDAGYLVQQYPKNYKFKIPSGRVGDVSHIVSCIKVLVLYSEEWTCKLSPSPPAFKEIRMQRTLDSEVKAARIARR